MFRYALIAAVLRIGQFMILTTIKTYGLENIPKSGPYITVLNHVSVADTPVLLMSFPRVHWRYFAGEKWRKHPVFGPIMTWLGAIYINQDDVDRKALKEALDALKDGAVFGLAPEGHRSKGGKMSPAKDGAAYLASRGGVPVVPIGLVNLDVLFANVLRLKRTRVEMHVGEPFMLPDVGRRPKSQDMTAYTHLIMCRIAALIPERYHGYYADSPALKAILRGDDPWPHCITMAAKETASRQLSK
jgi:1-acyl-sn-glycerol-3-phosphate acyltransferase